MAYVDDMTMMMSKEVYSSIQEKSASIIAEVRMKQASMNKEIALSGRNDGQYTVMEQMLSRIWSIHLGLSEIDLYDDFYEYGGDSIIGLKMASDIYRESGIQVNPSRCAAISDNMGLGAYLQTLEESEDMEREQSVIPYAEAKGVYALSSTEENLLSLYSRSDNISYNLNKALIMEEIRSDYVEQAYEHSDSAT